ncbi:MAG: branched-chain amino acid ABC transporter permease [Actinobacteria bacterium]|nr:MAG: branched-chain amino acid ABC transporter permease [Actinomycetota bacterium]
MDRGLTGDPDGVGGADLARAGQLRRDRGLRHRTAVAAITAAVAALLGIVALRVRGLYLAVATLIFAYMTQTFLFSQSWLVGEGGASSISPPRIGRRGTVMYFDLSSAGLRYLVILAALAAALLSARHIRRSKTGRAFLAVRGSEMAAVSLGIDVTRYKLLAFAISGALAGLAGNLTMIDLGTARSHRPRSSSRLRCSTFRSPSSEGSGASAAPSPRASSSAASTSSSCACARSTAPSTS